MERRLEIADLLRRRVKLGIHAGSLTPGDRRALSDHHAARAPGHLRDAWTLGLARDAATVERMRTDPDLAPLRSRSDYLLLLRDLIFPPDPFARPH